MTKSGISNYFIRVIGIHLLISSTNAQLSINVRLKEHDVVRETFASNITDGTVILNLKKLDGTLITHIQNFFDEVQIIKMTVLGSEYVGEDSDVSYSVCFAFKLPVKKPNEIDEETYEYVGPEAMVKLRQKNPSVIRVAEEDKGVFHAVFNSAIDITKSSIISQSVYHNCRGSGEVVYLTEDVKDVPSLKDAEKASQLDDVVQTIPDIQSSPYCSLIDSENFQQPCLCHLRVCIPWYPCGLKFCQTTDNKGKQTQYRIALKKLRQLSKVWLLC
ncbi:out at first protein-like isoform X2 [Artemia franciscana]|uniref:out at first protein-like isoform X2 n=1 Tax=Artemia franciscana TaxID=6661 RepID=UPI0032DBDAB3